MPEVDLWGDSSSTRGGRANFVPRGTAPASLARGVTALAAVTGEIGASLGLVLSDSNPSHGKGRAATPSVRLLEAEGIALTGVVCESPQPATWRQAQSEKAWQPPQAEPFLSLAQTCIPRGQRVPAFTLWGHVLRLKPKQMFCASFVRLAQVPSMACGITEAFPQPFPWFVVSAFGVSVNMLFLGRLRGFGWLAGPDWTGLAKSSWGFGRTRSTG